MQEAASATELSTSSLARYVLAEMPYDLEAVRAETMTYTNIAAINIAHGDPLIIDRNAGWFLTN